MNASQRLKRSDAPLEANEMEKTSTKLDRNVRRENRSLLPPKLSMSIEFKSNELKPQMSQSCSLAHTKLHFNGLRRYVFVYLSNISRTYQIKTGYSVRSEKQEESIFQRGVWVRALSTGANIKLIGSGFLATWLMSPFWRLDRSKL